MTNNDIRKLVEQLSTDERRQIFDQTVDVVGEPTAVKWLADRYGDESGEAKAFKDGLVGASSRLGKAETSNADKQDAEAYKQSLVGGENR